MLVPAVLVATGGAVLACALLALRGGRDAARVVPASPLAMAEAVPAR